MEKENSETGPLLIRPKIQKTDARNQERSRASKGGSKRQYLQILDLYPALGFPDHCACLVFLLEKNEEKVYES